VIRLTGVPPARSSRWSGIRRLRRQRSCRAKYGHGAPGAGLAAAAAGDNREVRRARMLARQLRILAAVIREPGLHPGQLSARAGISERTLRRDLTALRRLGYPLSYNDGYQLQEALRLDGPEGPRGLGGVYEQQVRALRAMVPAQLAERVEAELEAEAPASLAALIATVLERSLR
jgi:predicted DNA-binding transcriptional regulator YafY